METKARLSCVNKQKEGHYAIAISLLGRASERSKDSSDGDGNIVKLGLYSQLIMGNAPVSMALVKFLR